MRNPMPEERLPSRSEPVEEKRDRRARTDDDRRAPPRDDEHDGGFGDGPLL
jgi:hypothetical protein